MAASNNLQSHKYKRLIADLISEAKVRVKYKGDARGQAEVEDCSGDLKTQFSWNRSSFLV